MSKYLKFVPILLLGIIIASVVFFGSAWWSIFIYPYIFQIYPMIMLGALLGYAIKEKHDTYLKIILVGLIDINILNCVVKLFNITNWMPATITVLVVTIILVISFSIFKKTKS